MNFKDKFYLPLNIKEVFLVLLVLSFLFLLLTNTVSASETNLTSEDSLSSNLDLSNQEVYSSNTIKEDGINKSMLLISDKGGTNIFDLAALEVINNSQYDDVNIQVRSSYQIYEMKEADLYNLINSSDIVIVNWLTTDADAVLTNLLLKAPELSNKELFLVLETSSSSQAKTFNLVRNSTINYKKVFENREIFTNDYLNTYFEKTKRGSVFSTVNTYLTTGEGNKVDPNFNKAILYKNCNNKENQLNEILFALNITGYKTKYKDPSFSDSYEYGLYREKYMSLEKYKSKYFKSDRPYTIGLLESNMYVHGEELQPYYELIRSLESKGFNVIPVVAAGGSENQLRVMIEYFTNAPDYKSFLLNSSNYTNYIDAIVSMPAYGIGAYLFDNTTRYFEEAGVPVYRAVHSDFVSNGEWELSSTGLPGNRSDKWWHVAIAEAQGIIEPTFIGGTTNSITPQTGARRSGYEPHLKNIDLFTDRIQSWVQLKYTNNSDKKLSLVYYNYPPGKQNIGSSYLDSITSIYNLLHILKDQGYNVGELPKNTSELENMIINYGINVANWAPGELEKLANTSNVVLLPVTDYLKWFNSLEPISRLQVVEGPVAYIGELSRNAININYTSTMDEILDDWFSGVVALLPDNYKTNGQEVLTKITDSLRKYLNSGSESDYNTFLNYKKEFINLKIPGLNGWGEAPGNIMTIKKDGIEYFVIPGLAFGNIFVTPEPQRGWEANSNALYHSSAVAPTHQYLAAYYYMQKDYSSAMVFVGRHGTHEWLPGKEVLLSSTDYGSIVVGKVPQLYFYISDGLAEGVQAKRRGFAVMIAHLTSPLSYTNLYGNLTKIANLINQYENSYDNKVKDNISLEIKKYIRSNNYLEAMSLTESQLNNLTSIELINKADKFIHDIQDKLYPLGLHAIGQKWTDKDIGRSVSTALSHEFTWNGITTTLYDELAKIKYSRNFKELNALERDNIINISSDVIISLIYSNSMEVAKVIGSDSSSLIAALDYGRHYINLIDLSIKSEVQSFIDGLNCKYIRVCYDGDILDIHSLPTGGNFFHDQSQELPISEAYEYAKILTLLTLSKLTDDVQKVVMGIWCVETARDDGALVSVVLHLLGMKPIYTDSPSAGGLNEDPDHGDHDYGKPVGKKTKLVPDFLKLEDLVRPEDWAKKRIDVTIITSGNFRDLYSTQISLLDNAFRIALARSYVTILNNDSLMNSKWGNEIAIALDEVVASVDYCGVGKESLDENYVAIHWLNDFIFYKELGFNTSYAGEVAITRIFAPPNGDFGAGISKAVSLIWTWNDSSYLGDFYLKRMGNMYSKKYWGQTDPIVFARALNNTDKLIASRNTNVYGVADNDDFFDYWGGLSLAMTLVNGKEPDMNILMYGDKSRPYINSIEEVLMKEILTRYFNPEWIKGMMGEGYSGARYISNKFVTNLLGWAVTRQGLVSNGVWDELYNVYFKDKYGLKVDKWLQTGNNNYALISSAGIMLTAAHEGYWKTSDAVLSNIANTWAQAVVQNGVACCDCSCGNIAMMQWAVKYINPDLLAQFKEKLYEAIQNDLFKTSKNPSNPNPSNPNLSNSNPSNPIKTNKSSSSLSEDISYGGIHSEFSGSVGSEISKSPSSTSKSESGNTPSGKEGKSYEVSKETSSSSSNVGMSIPAIIAIIFMVLLVAIGYYRGRQDKVD